MVISNKNKQKEKKNVRKIYITRITEIYTIENNTT